MLRTKDREPLQPTIIGLILALVAPVLYAVLVGPLLLQPVMSAEVYALVGFAVYWLLAFGLIAITRFGENKLPASLGVKSLSGRMITLAIGLGLLLSLTVPFLTFLTNQILPVSETAGVIDTATRYPAWIILLSVLTAGVTEEVLFRGYAFERLLHLTGNLWLSALISLTVFVVVHLSAWNLAHILGVVFPLGVLLTGLYVWQRNLWFVIIIHILVDLPLFLLALGQ